MVLQIPVWQPYGVGVCEGDKWCITRKALIKIMSRKSVGLFVPSHHIRHLKRDDEKTSTTTAQLVAVKIFIQIIFCVKI